MVTAPDGRQLKLTGDRPPSDADLDEVFASLPPVEDVELQQKEMVKQDEGLLEIIDKAARENPIVKGLAEFQGGINRSALDIVDFFTTDQLNSVLEISGSDKRVPTLRQTFGGTPEVEGGFMDEGLAKDVVGTAGEFVPTTLAAGGVARQAAKALPAVTQGESALVGTVREMGKVTPAQDVVFGATMGS